MEKDIPYEITMLDEAVCVAEVAAEMLGFDVCDARIKYYRSRNGDFVIEFEVTPGWVVQVHVSEDMEITKGPDLVRDENRKGREETQQ